MTDASKAQTDREMAAAQEIAQARRARLANAASLIDNATRQGVYGRISLAQVTRPKLARIVLALGGTVTTQTTRTAMVLFIEQEMSA